MSNLLHSYAPSVSAALTLQAAGCSVMNSLIVLNIPHNPLEVNMKIQSIILIPSISLTNPSPLPYHPLTTPSPNPQSSTFEKGHVREGILLKKKKIYKHRVHTPTHGGGWYSHD